MAWEVSGGAVGTALHTAGHQMPVAPPLITIITKNSPAILQTPSWGPSHLSEWKTTG